MIPPASPRKGSPVHSPSLTGVLALILVVSVLPIPICLWALATILTRMAW